MHKLAVFLPINGNTTIEIPQDERGGRIIIGESRAVDTLSRVLKYSKHL